jgi:hypothetical protein
MTTHRTHAVRRALATTEAANSQPEGAYAGYRPWGEGFAASVKPAIPRPETPEQALNAFLAAIPKDLQRSKVRSDMEKPITYAGKVLPRYVWLFQITRKGRDTLDLQLNPSSNPSRAAYNRMDGYAQDRWEREQVEKGFKLTLHVVDAQGGYEVNKTEMEFLRSLGVRFAHIRVITGYLRDRSATAMLKKLLREDTPSAKLFQQAAQEADTMSGVDTLSLASYAEMVNAQLGTTLRKYSALEA